MRGTFGRQFDKSKAVEPQVIRLLAQYFNVPPVLFGSAVGSSDKAGSDLFLPRSAVDCTSLYVPGSGEYVTFDYKYRWKRYTDLCVELGDEFLDGSERPGPLFREGYLVADYFAQMYKQYPERIDVLEMEPLTEALTLPRINAGDSQATYAPTGCVSA